MSKFKDAANTAAKLKKELYKGIVNIASNAFSTIGKAYTYNDTDMLDFEDGAMWKGNDGICSDIIVKGFQYNRQSGRYYLNGYKGSEPRNIAFDVLSLEDLVMLVNFLEKNGYDLDELSKESQAPKESPKEQAAEEVPAEKPAKAPDDGKEPAGKDNHEEESEKEVRASFTGKPITPSDKVFG